MTQFKFFAPLLIAMLFVVASCTKEGPAGAVGATGPAGPTGPQGPVGSPNVVFSDWFTPAQNGNWVDTSVNGVAAQKKFRKSAPGATLNVLNTGVVLSYIKLVPDGSGGTTTSIRQLPYANPGTANEFISLNYVGSITYVVVSTVSPGVAVTAPSTGLEFRYVVVPGGVSGGRFTNGPASGYTADQLKNMSYEEVAALFNIPAEGTNQK